LEDDVRRERAVGESLWEAVLPQALLRLPAELERVDAILAEDRFLVRFRSRLTATTGRPTIPVETYLRLMYLKDRYGRGYETLVVVADRGFATATARDELARRGIRDVVIPARGRAGPREQTRAWRPRYRFRNDIEGRISQAKRHGLRRTRLRGLAGAQTSVGGLTLAHNLRRIATLTA
jgi:IS5 family transposase